VVSVAKLSANGHEVARLTAARLLEEQRYEWVYSYRSNGKVLSKGRVNGGVWSSWRHSTPTPAPLAAARKRRDVLVAAGVVVDLVEVAL
jgi:hypothetical protein